MKTLQDARVAFFVLGAICGWTFANTGVSAAAPAPKMTICHVPPGNPSNAQLITVGAPAVAAHLRLHGDAVCAAGSSSCCADPSGEVCTNVGSDVNNCGGCNVVCAAGDVCSSGVCTCPIAGDTNCNGTCTDLRNDPNNCGACGNVCATGTTCNAGACSPITGGPCGVIRGDPNAGTAVCGGACPVEFPFCGWVQGTTSGECKCVDTMCGQSTACTTSQCPGQTDICVSTGAGGCACH